jgi:hypothetical protein
MKSFVLHPAARAGVLADSINDADSTRKVYLLAAGLAALGIVLIAMTVWFWRSTRHDPELLAPLETMGSRRFRKMDDGSKRQLLDAVRPADAKPMRWGVVRGSATAEPEVDLGAIRHAAVSDYNDLREPAVPVIEAVAAAPGVADAIVDEPAGDEAAVQERANERPTIGGPAGKAAGDVDTGEPAVITTASRPEGEPVVEPAAESLADEPNPTAWIDPLVRPMIAADRPRFKPDPRPFVIAPLDHDMPASIVDHVVDESLVSADGHDTADDATAATSRPAIDPLLRRFEHTD